MARVATNQERAEAERVHYVYVQHAYIASRRGSRVMCEETTDSRVTPQPSGSHKQLISLQGREWRKGAYENYQELKKEPGEAQASADEAHDSITISTDDKEMDRDLVEHMRKNLTDEQSKDGFSAGLFPLTSKGQERFVFSLLGRERMNGHDVFHINFRPKDKSEFDWQGEVYVDSLAYQPVLLRTKLARNVPFLVRTMLGTSIPGLGFSVAYAPQPDGTWFPVNFGSEFKINVIFFFHRHIAIGVENAHFEKTHSSGRIVGEARPVSPTP